MNKKESQLIKYGKRIAILAIWIILWQVLAILVDNPILMASPLHVLRTLLKNMQSASFYLAAGMSLAKIMIGVVFGFLLGIIISSISYRFRIAEEFLKPGILAMKAVPVASFVVLLLIWSGSDALSIWASFLVVLPSVYANCLEGLKSIDQKMLEMAEVFHINPLKKSLYLYRPAIMPYLIGNAKYSIGMGFKSGVAAEVIGIAGNSIGEKLYLSKVYLDTAGVLAWTLVVIILTFLAEKLFLWILKRIADMKCSFIIKRSSVKYNKENRQQATEKTVKIMNVTKQYNEVLILDKINMLFEPEKCYCLMAESGAGKTTLIRILAGLEQGYEGHIAGIEKGDVSVMFQEDRLCENLTAMENVMLTNGMDGTEMELKQILSAEVLNIPAEKLSGGMRRRIALVRAMIYPATIVFLDEPFTGLDYENKKKAAAYIKKRSKNKIVLVTTHQEEDVALLEGIVWKPELH